MELLARIVRRITGAAPIVIAIGCQGPRVDKNPPKPAAVVEHAPKQDSTEENEPKQLGSFDITFYYVIGEDEVKPAKKVVAANDNETELAAIAPTNPGPDQEELVTLYEPKSCEPIAVVAREFASQLQLQGTGKLHDGRVLNIWGKCSCDNQPCFKVTENQWGTGGTGRPLQPFRTVAVDPGVVKLGSLLYVPLLEGRTMPGRAPWGGYVHDGCVIADDTGGGIDGHQLDLFVGKKGWYQGMRSAHGGSHAWARHVPVFDGSKICERKGRHVGRKAASI